METGAVLGTSLRLLVRHWPVLFALFFAGAAGREFAVIGAVQVSKINGVLGLLVVILGPIATLAALVLMLHALRPSLPWLAVATANADPAGAADGEAPPRRKTLLDHLGSALVPFLAVYASWGYLQEDIVDYLGAVFVDTYLADATIFTDPSAVAEILDRRMPSSLTTTIVAVVVVAVALRWLLTRLQDRRRMRWLGIIGAYLEVIWITVVVVTVSQVQDPVLQWVQERRVVIWLLDLWHDSVSKLGPLSEPVRTAGEWLVGAFASADVVIVVPLAWLAVGAVVYGHQLAPPTPSPTELLQRATKRWQAMPKPVRVVGTNLSADVRERFMPLVHGLRLMVRAGLAPMLSFCLAFLVAQTAREWMWEAERFVIGPQDLQSVWRPVSGPLSILNDAVGTVVLACLLGAAVDRVLRIQPPAPPADQVPDADAQPAVSRA
jgi:hypothetical protein